MRTLLLSLLTVCALATEMGAARAESATETIREPASGVGFDSAKTVDGKGYTLVGVGLRKKFGFKVYAMGLYVENVDGKRAFPSLATKAGGTDKAKLTEGDRAQSFIVWGSFGKIGVMHFVRDVGQDKVREAFQEGLGDELSDKAPADVREAANGFLKMVDRDFKVGDEMTIKTSPDGKVEASIAGTSKGSVQNVKLARAIWNLWLGNKPVTKELKADLVNRIDELGK